MANGPRIPELQKKNKRKKILINLNFLIIEMEVQEIL